VAWATSSRPSTQCYDANRVDGKADVYSLGVILYEALAGRRPIEGEDYVQVLVRHLTMAPEPLGLVVPNVPADLAVLVMAMLAKDPAVPPTMEDVRKQLDSLIGMRDLRPVALPLALPQDSQEVLPAAGITRAVPALRRWTILAFVLPVTMLSGCLWLLLRATAPLDSHQAQRGAGQQLHVASASIALLPPPTPIKMEVNDSCFDRYLSEERAPPICEAMRQRADPQHLFDGQAARVAHGQTSDPLLLSEPAETQALLCVQATF
jgi:serine/threonine protein kinase